MGRHLSKRSPMVRFEITLPRQLTHRLRLIRGVTGIPVKEWCRLQLQIACDMELTRRPGAFWLRPGSRIYRLNLEQRDVEPVPVPITAAQGGERVWVREIFPDLHVGRGDPGLGPKEQDGSILCDLSADEDGQVELRAVVVACGDVLPMAVPYTTGLGYVKARKERERRRKLAEEDLLGDAES